MDLATYLCGAVNCRPEEVSEASDRTPPEAPRRLECVSGPCDGEILVDDGEEHVTVPHLLFDEAGRVTEAVNCVYRREPGCYRFVGRKNAIRIRD